MKFKNKKGKDLKTTMSNGIINKIADLTESELKESKVFYTRDGTRFNVMQIDIQVLLDAQMKATKKLVEDGVITQSMIKKELKSNF